MNERSRGLVNLVLGDHGRWHGPAMAATFVLALCLVATAPGAHAGGSGPAGGHNCPPAGNPKCGDPITIGTGNVFHEITDYETAGPNQLTLKRYYNGPLPDSFNVQASFWPWRSSFDSAIFVPGPCCSVDVIRPDNKNFWVRDIDGGTGPPNINARLNIQGGVYSVTDWDDTTWTYARAEPFGSSTLLRLTSIRYRTGYTQTVQYLPCDHPNCPLSSVTDSYGRTLTFSYAFPGDNRIRAVTTPDGTTITYAYDGAGRLGGATYPTSPSTSQAYLYEDATFTYGLTGIIDENGNRSATWAYEDTAGSTFGFALSSERAGGVDRTTVVYHADGSRLVTNALGQQELYKFTQFNGGTSGPIPLCVEIDRLATATTPAAKRFFTYDGNGFPASATDWNGNQTTYANDARGRPLTIVEAAGTPQQRVTTVTWHATFNLPVRIVTSGLTIDLVYDTNGNLLTRTETDTTTATQPYSTNGQARTWSYTWANFLLASITDPRGHTTQFAYDASGALTATTNPLGHVTKITEHSGGGLPLTAIDPNGVMTTYAYDGRQRPLGFTVNTGAGPLATSYGYDPAGNLTTVTLPDGSAVAYAYDPAGRIVGMSDLLNNQLAYTLNGLDNRTALSISAGAIVTRTRSATFDSLGRMLTDVGGVGQTTAYVYDANGNTVKITDPRNRATTQVFDALDRRTRITDAGFGVTTFLYDPHDRPVTVTDASGHATTYVYNGFGDVIQVVSPDAGTTVYRYDAAGNRVQRIDGAGRITDYGYDALDRLTAVTYPGAPAENVSYHYDEPAGGFGIGQLTTVVDAAGTLHRTYDERGNLLTDTRTHGAWSAVTGYAYDGAGRVQAITYPSGIVATYTRDIMGRITAFTAAIPGSASTGVVDSIAYLPFGPAQSLRYGNGLVETRSFDQDYRQTGLGLAGSATLLDVTYTYDAADNVVSFDNAAEPGSGQSFVYDSRDRLLGAAGSYGFIGYSYDAVGNVLSLNDGSQTTKSFAYVPGSSRLVSVTSGGVTRQFDYDPSGNVTRDSQPHRGLSLRYNRANRLASVGPINDSPVLFSTSRYQYTYDGFGQRTLKARAWLTAATVYHHDDDGRLLEEGTASSSGLGHELQHLYLGDRPVATLTAGGLMFLHGDRLGTPQLATDALQGVTWKATYQPFGETQVAVEDFPQHLRFPGQYSDAETGYVHNGLRTYEPTLGRYLQSDRLGLRGGPNLYAYAMNNPANVTDPSGLYPLKNCPDCVLASKENQAKGILGFIPNSKTVFVQMPGAQPAGFFCFTLRYQFGVVHPVPTKDRQRKSLDVAVVRNKHGVKVHEAIYVGNGQYLQRDGVSDVQLVTQKFIDNYGGESSAVTYERDPNPLPRSQW